MNNPVTSVYFTNLFHGTAGLLLAQSSGILQPVLIFILQLKKLFV